VPSPAVVKDFDVLEDFAATGAPPASQARAALAFLYHEIISAPALPAASLCAQISTLTRTCAGGNHACAGWSFRRSSGVHSGGAVVLGTAAPPFFFGSSRPGICGSCTAMTRRSHAVQKRITADAFRGETCGVDGRNHLFPVHHFADCSGFRKTIRLFFIPAEPA